MPKKVLPYEKLDKSTKNSFRNFYEKILKSGKTIDQVLKMDLKTFNKTFKPYGVHLTKNSSLVGKKSLIKQIKNRYTYIADDYIKKNVIQDTDYKEFIFNRSIELLKIKKEKIKDIEELKHKPIKKKGQYGLVILTNLRDNKEYYVKYTDKKSLEKRIEELKRQYRISNYTTRITGVYMYKTYITKEFKKKLSKLGLS